MPYSADVKTNDLPLIAPQGGSGERQIRDETEMDTMQSERNKDYCQGFQDGFAKAIDQWTIMQTYLRRAGKDVPLEFKSTRT